MRRTEGLRGEVLRVLPKGGGMEVEIEEGFAWIRVPFIGGRFVWTVGRLEGGWWHTIHDGEVYGWQPSQVVVGPRVKGQEACQSDD